MVLVARLVTTAAAAGGLLLGSVALGGGLASAAPAPTALVPASCGQTVSAMPGDTVRVTPRVGVPEDYVVGGSPGTTARIPSTMTRPMCDVSVRMLAPPMVYAPAPVAAAPMAAAPVAAAPAAAPGAPVAPGAAVAPGSRLAPVAPAAPAPAAPRAAAPTPAAGAAHSSGTATSSSAGSLGQASAPFSPSAPLSPASLLAPPAPAAPAVLAPPADPAANVVSASNNSALPPADSSGGMGVPVLIALIAGTGVAALGVRMFLMRRGSTPAHAAGEGFEPEDFEPLDEPLTVHTAS